MAIKHAEIAAIPCLVRFQMRSLDMLMYLILQAHCEPLGLPSLLQKRIANILLGGKPRPASKADNLTAICELNIYKKMWEPRRPVTGIALLSYI
jgi:hypothetical protein